MSYKLLFVAIAVLILVSIVGGTYFSRLLQQAAVLGTWVDAVEDAKPTAFQLLIVEVESVHVDAVGDDELHQRGEGGELRLFENRSVEGSFHAIADVHKRFANEFLHCVDSSSFIGRACTEGSGSNSSSKRASTTRSSWCDDVAVGRLPRHDETPPSIYPQSVAAYAHPFGSCSDPRRRVSLSNYQSTFGFGDSDPSSNNFTRFWPHFPDARVAPNTSEHERCHFVMTRMLAIVATILGHYNMTNWFITHATLLGAVRHGGFIPWDTDIDIAMPRSHLTFLRKRWRREFPRDMFLQTEKTDTAFHMWNGKERAIRIKDRYSSFPGMRFSVHKGFKRFRQKKYHLGAHVDVIPLERRGGGGRYKILHSYFEARDVYPLTTVCFENMVLPAPRNTTAFLSTIYGDDFMKPPRNTSFGGPTVLPCMATQRMRGNPWSLSWESDHSPRPSSHVDGEVGGGGLGHTLGLKRGGGSDDHVHQRRWPRDDPDHGTFLSDYKTPHRLYYNSKW
jgi:hypothetical protein